MPSCPGCCQTSLTLTSHLLLGSRDVTRGQAAVQQLVGDLGENVKTRLDLVQLDVCSDKSVTAAMQTIKTKLKEGESLYGLVNNAGGILADPRQTIDLNTYGPVRVCLYCSRTKVETDGTTALCSV